MSKPLIVEQHKFYSELDDASDKARYKSVLDPSDSGFMPALPKNSH